MARRQLWVYVLALLSVTGSDAHGNPDTQEPLRGDSLTSKPASLQSTPRNSTIKLYPASYASNKHFSCSPSQPSETLSLPPDVCLSGDYYLSSNVALNVPPVCPDDLPAYLALFRRRGCTGTRTFIDLSRTPLPACFDKSKWPLGTASAEPKSWSHWSLMFYCTHLETARLADGALTHASARPPSVGAASRGPKAGQFRIFATRAACRAGTDSVKDEEFEAGSYLNLPAYVDPGKPAWVHVSEPAYCADGSRAQLALYQDVDCASHHHEGTHDHDAVLMDVTDEEGGQCLDVKEYKAVAFSCTGLGKMPPHKAHAEPGRSSWGVLLLVVPAILVLGLVGLLATKGTDGVVRIMNLLLRKAGVKVELKKLDKTS